MIKYKKYIWIDKELFLLAAEHTIIKLKGYSERSDKALADLKALLENWFFYYI
jgi:hypothetical protein